MHSAPAQASRLPPAPASHRDTWTMLLALTTAFALSQSWRSVAALMAAPLQSDFGLSPQALGLFAGAFHFAFGAMQLFMGIGIDLHGVRRTVLTAFPVAIAGSAVSAMAGSYGMLVVGQVLIGIGCAPAFLVCTVFIARNMRAERFAAISGITLGLGGIGMLLTSTPLAWLIEASSWRMGFWVLGAMAALSWLLIWALVHEPAPAEHNIHPKESVRQALAGFGALFTLPHTLGIMLLACVGYASFIALRGLWLGPLLMERHGFSLVQSGNVALVMSLASLFGPPLFGWLDPGPLHRRRWITGLTLLLAALFAAFAMTHNTVIDVVGPVVIGLLSGFMVLQYADVRAAYPAAMTGRAMAVFTMAIFLGVAAVQWFTGLVASVAASNGAEPYTAVLAAIGLLLALGALAFIALPQPPRGGN
ncbi:MAG: MFS transporter [Pseudomonadota bacterium]|uniref:MFS transporter n=1 Tax=Polaromonas sp. TaxID=1869339 RepID=UPI0018246F55|nr:MFS transporter [Polaromonas sp.]MBA3594926.1 MFS transporter [Polaromonas sp.]MDQ3272158.1 MFS transporter [Pseudomonadota bacterium]